MKQYDIIIKPLLTEKSYVGIPNKKYTFVVAKEANKVQIKKAIEDIFGVSVKQVNTANVRGKVKRQGTTSGKTASYKKAIVQLTEDSKPIAFFESLS
ncbi:MAG: 50S ribosomal protein L23 [Spirochaetales bacterium]